MADADVAPETEAADTATATDESVEEEKSPEQQIIEEEAAAAEAGDTEDEAPGDGSEEAEADDEDGSDDSEAEDSEADDEDAEEAEEVDPKTQSRREYAARRQVREQVTTELDKLAKPQTAQDILTAAEQKGEVLDPALAEVEALRQEMQRKELISNITDLNADMNQDATNVMREYPIFDEQSSEYDADFTKEVEDLYKESAKLQMDPSGKFVVRSEVPLYKFYAAFAKARTAGAAKAAIKGQKAAEKNLASADTPAAAAPSTNSEVDDPFLRGLTGTAPNHN